MNTQKTYYTVGFIFDVTMSQVLLVHKTKPNWQDGKINGIGGKFEPQEDMYDCIVRETKEESDLVVDRSEWLQVGTLYWPGKEIYVMAAVYDGLLANAVQNDYEQVEWFDCNGLPENILDNLHWLIPMSKQALLGQTSEFSSHVE